VSLVLDDGFVDLQLHSTASDGLLAPGAIPALALAAGLRAIALTDHDSIDGLPAATAAAAPLGLRVIPGVELSAVTAGREVHLLGLHLRPDAAFADRLAELRGQRAERAVRIVRALQRLGLAITDEDVATAAGTAAVGRPHVAAALVARGHVADRREAFERYLGAGKPGYEPKPEFPARDAIALIHAAGGLAIWAHPGAAGRRDAVQGLVDVGLDGLEVKHPSHNAEDQQRLAALVEHFGLVPSGGSDWHGETTGRRTLGVMRVPAAWLAAQDARCAAAPGPGQG
jgi:predicted metal-dependent phosphoesterase TrpH